MSTTPQCELNDELDADFVIGSTATGEQNFLCAGHAAHWGLTLALSVLDPAEIINAASALQATPPQNGGPEAPANRPARKRAGAKAKAKPVVEPEPGLPEAPAAADDRGDRGLQPGEPEP